MISLKYVVALALLTATFGAALPVRGQQEVIAGSVYDQDKENEVVTKAKKRTYVGGRDESDLVVQSQLIAPTRKIAPQVESSGDTGADE